MSLHDEQPSAQDLPSLPDLPGLEGIGAPLKKPAEEIPGGSTPGNPAAGGLLKAEFEHSSGVRILPPQTLRQEPADAPSAASASQPATEPISAADPNLGRMFGGYQLEAKIGQGGMGLVYKGRQVSLDRVVAIKLLNKALCENVEFIKRFEREAKSIAKINHPNIVGVYDFGQSDGIWYMASEYVEGQSLSTLIADKLMLTVEEVQPIMVNCLSALAHVGAQGVVHRDIKPDNILITRDGLAKILDFGLAKNVSNTNDATDLTAVGLAMGTPAYMSPEQCMGRRLDGRSDIYALGVTAYLALTGEKPFVGQSSFEVMTKQREYTPPPPIKLNPRIPAAVSDLIMRMLAKNPHERFPDAEQCRLAWVDAVGRVTPVPRVSGEFRVPVPSIPGNRQSVELPALPAISQIAAPAKPVDLATIPPVAQPAPSSASARHGEARGVPTTEVTRGGPGRRPVVGGDGPTVETDPQRQAALDRRASRGASTGEAVTCAKCGALNRGDAATCTRCGFQLHEVDEATAQRNQEVEAQRVFDQGSYREAATIYAKLADKEQDRRLRSVLRSKEREARKLEQEHQLTDLRQRSQGMIARGDLKGAIALLEAGRDQVRDVTASTAGAEADIEREIATLRARLGDRRRVIIIAVLVVVVGALAAGAYYRFMVLAGPLIGRD